MSTVVEIESAIEKLSGRELAELSKWMEPRVRKVESKKRAIESTAGYLTEADDDFVVAVEEAGRDVPDSHDW
jgi:hypothetical protein